MNPNLDEIKIMLMDAIWERICERGQWESAIEFGTNQGRISQIKNKKPDKIGITWLLIVAKQVGIELEVNIVEVEDYGSTQIDIFT